MKNSFRILLFICVSFLSLQANGQIKSKSLHYDKNFKKNFVAIKKNLYACKYETSNLDYLLFLFDVKNRMNPAIYQSLLPDTNRWKDPGVYNEPYVNYYLRHPAYYYYPLVNINYEQANFYCTWLTQQYNNNPKRKFKKVVFKMPSLSEWQLMATAADTANHFPWGNTIEIKPKEMMVNYCSDPQMGKLKREKTKIVDGKEVKTIDSLENVLTCDPINGHFYTQPVNLKKARQTKTGFYHVAGNVSEMVASKGECMGGNFLSQEFWLRTDAPNEFYPGYIACPLIGFRIFMQVIEE